MGEKERGIRFEDDVIGRNNWIKYFARLHSAICKKYSYKYYLMQMEVSTRCGNIRK